MCELINVMLRSTNSMAAWKDLFVLFTRSCVMAKNAPNRLDKRYFRFTAGKKADIVEGTVR